MVLGISLCLAKKIIVVPSVLHWGTPLSQVQDHQDQLSPAGQ
jgi:hypothetical protein